MTTDLTPPPAFGSPRLGLNYADFGRAEPNPFEITVTFWQIFGVVPEEVLWIKPGYYVAGPVYELVDPEPGEPEPVAEDDPPAVLLLGWAPEPASPAAVEAGLDAASQEGIRDYHAAALAEPAQPSLF